MISNIAAPVMAAKTSAPLAPNTAYGRPLRKPHRYTRHYPGNDQATYARARPGKCGSKSVARRRNRSLEFAAWDDYLVTKSYRIVV